MRVGICTEQRHALLPQPDLRGCTALVVDDNPTSREILEEMLESFSFEVGLACSGEEALTEMDKKYLKFADEIEKRFISQGDEERSIEKTLSIAWDLFAILPEDELKRIKREYIKIYHPAYKEKGG